MVRATVAATFAVSLSDNLGRRLRDPVPEVDILLLERTLFDPPRAAAAGRWAESLRALFPNAELVPYVWHLISHGVEDGLRAHASRTLSGPPHAFGQLQDTPECAQAWDAMAQCIAAIGSERLALRTPASVTPGALGRKRITTFVQTRGKVLWEPQGLWTPEEASAFATLLGVPLIHPAFEGGRPVEGLADDAWLRVDPVGKNPRLGGDQLDLIEDHLDEHPDATLVFTGPQAIANLRALTP